MRAPDLYYPENPSYQLLIYILINLEITTLSEDLKIKDLDEGAQTEIQTILDKINEYKNYDEPTTLLQRYRTLNFLFDKLGKPLLGFPSLLDFNAEFVNKNKQKRLIDKFGKEVSLKTLCESLDKDAKEKLDNFEDSYRAKGRLSDYSESFIKYFYEGENFETIKSLIVLLVSNVKDKVDTSKDPYGEEAIHGASRFGRPSIIEGFIENKVDINAIDNRGHTPLFFACRNDKEDCLEHLLNRGADISLINSLQKTVLHYAVINGTLGHVEVLLNHVIANHQDKGVTFINQKDENGDTALHYVARVLNDVREGPIRQKKMKEISSLLVQAKANPFVLNKKNESPASIAGENEPFSGTSKRPVTDVRVHNLIRKDSQIRLKYTIVKSALAFCYLLLSIGLLSFGITIFPEKQMQTKLAEILFSLLMIACFIGASVGAVLLYFTACASRKENELKQLEQGFFVDVSSGQTEEMSETQLDIDSEEELEMPLLNNHSP